MSRKLEGKVALIAGSTSGIGLATAKLFAEEGGQVVITGRRRRLGTDAAEAIRKTGGEASYFQADFAEMDSVRSTVRFTLNTYGRVDILINNTVSWATARDMPVTHLAEKDWDYAMAVGLKAPYIACQEAIPSMMKQGAGCIVMMGSVRSFLAFSGGFAYDIIKAGLVNMARQLTVDFGQYGIRANALCPGWIDTDIQRSSLHGTSSDVLQMGASIHPLRRIGLPLDIARACLFLVSDDASFIAGSVLVVDGGLTVQTPGSILTLLKN